MKIIYNEEADSLYIRFSNLPYGSTEQLRDNISLDIDDIGGISGVEFLDASTVFPDLDLTDVGVEIVESEQ